MKITFALAALLLVGCAAKENLPTVHWHGEREALDILAGRAAAVRTVAAQGTITLTRPNGESVRLDLAMVREGRDRLRLRAWKFGRAVFDLTMNAEGLWLFTPDDPSLKTKARSAGMNAQKLAENFGLLSGELFSRPTVAARDTGRLLEITDAATRCEVDRTALVPRRYALLDSAGIERFTLAPSDYRVFDGVPFAFRYLATSEDGQILIVLREVELNGELAAGAFVPPRRAEKLP